MAPENAARWWQLRRRWREHWEAFDAEQDALLLESIQRAAADRGLGPEHVEQALAHATENCVDSDCPRHPTVQYPTKEIAMETTWRVEEVTEKPGILSATLQRVEWFKKNPDFDAKLDEVGGTEGVDEFLDALPGELGAEAAEIGGTITLDVTDGPELHPLDDVILSLRVVVPVEV